MAREAVAKLSGLHYMSYECVPVTSPGAGAWTRLVWREYGDETGSRSPDLLVVSVPVPVPVSVSVPAFPCFPVAPMLRLYKLWKS